MVEVNRKTTGHYERNPYAARLATILASMVTPHSWLSPTPSSNPKLSNRHFLPVDMGDCHASRTGTATVHACNLARFNRYGQAFSIRHSFRVAQNNSLAPCTTGKTKWLLHLNFQGVRQNHAILDISWAWLHGHLLGPSAQACLQLPVTTPLFPGSHVPISKIWMILAERRGRAPRVVCKTSRCD